MEQFNIHKIIEYYQLDREVIAKVLFPNVKHPFESLRRVLNGVSVLDANQIATLAQYLGVLVCELYSVSANDWKGTVEEGHLVFIRGPYKVKLGYKGMYMTIYKNNQLIRNQVNCYAEMTVSEFINYINNLIQQHERD